MHISMWTANGSDPSLCAVGRLGSQRQFLPYELCEEYTRGIAVEILSVRPSVRLSVKRVYCDKKKAPSEKKVQL